MDTGASTSEVRVGIAAPRLLVDGRIATADGVGPAFRLLGLSLLERLALAARRSGYGAIVVLAHAADLPHLRSLVGRVKSVEFSTEAVECTGARTVYVPGTVVGERSWLEAASRVTVPEEGTFPLGAGVVVCGERVPPARAVAMMDGESAAPRSDAPMRLDSRADAAPASRRLMRSLGKSTDGFMERNVERPLSRILSRHLAATPVTPNQMTSISAVVGLSAAPFFLSSAPLWQTVGALVFLAHSILDGCDGELARLKFQESRWGGLLDFWSDNAVHAVIFGCMASGWSLAIGAAWPLALGAAAVLGALGSASFVYWRVMRPKRGDGPLYVSVARQQKSRLVGMLDSLSRRDFIYLVLLLSLFGKAAWFLTLAAVGAPIFLALLLVIAAQERGGGRPAHP